MAEFLEKGFRIQEPGNKIGLFKAFQSDLCLSAYPTMCQGGKECVRACVCVFVRVCVRESE